MQKLIRQFGEIRKSENDDRTVKFTFSTSATDRHRTVLNKEAWELDNFNRNGIAGYMHDVYGDGLLAKPDPDDVIGKARAWVEGDDLVGEITFEPSDLNEKADKVYRKIQFGSLNAVSVGFLEKGAGTMGDKDEGQDPNTYYFAGQELLEISVVNIPSNPEALKSRDFTPWNQTSTPVPEFQTDLTEEVTKSNNMSEEKKEDLAQDSKVQVEVKLDTGSLKEDIIDALRETREPLPGPPSPDLSRQDKKDLGSYSMTKAILKEAEAKSGRGKMDGIELEMHQEAIRESEEAGVTIAGLGVPTLIHSRADLAATIDAAGGYTVATELKGFIDTLKNQMVSIKAGARLMTGLKGNVSFPKASGNSTATWRSEKGTATQTDPTFTEITMLPHRLTTYTEYTTQLLKQSSIDVEKFVRENLYYSVANALESAVFVGGGSSNVPAGLENQSVNNADHGSNGTVLNWDNIVQMEQMVATDNALAGKTAYITNAAAAGKMKTTLKNDYQGGYIWENYSPVVPKGIVNGYDAYITNVLSTETKGTNTNCAAVFFGDWTKLMIGQWGGMDLLVNPYSLDTVGTIRVIIAGYYDVEVMYPEAFAAMMGMEL